MINDMTEDFRLVIKAGRLKAILKYMTSMADELEMFYSNEGIRFSGVDVAHVIMIQLKLRKESFESFKIRAPGSLKIELDRMLDEIRSEENDTLITIAGSGEDKRYLMAFDGYESFLENDPYEMMRPKPPVLKLAVELNLDYGLLQKMLRRVAKSSEAVQIEFSKKGLIMRAYSEKETWSRTTIAPNMLFEVVDRNKQGEYLSIFPSEYITRVIVNGLDEMYKEDMFQDVKIRMGQDWPIELEIDSVIFWSNILLAPRISDD